MSTLQDYLNQRWEYARKHPYQTALDVGLTLGSIAAPEVGLPAKGVQAAKPFLSMTMRKIASSSKPVQNELSALLREGKALGADTAELMYKARYGGVNTVRDYLNNLKGIK